MNGIDIFIILILFVMVIMAVAYMRKKKTMGGCGGCPCRGNCTLAKKADKINQGEEDK